MTTFVNWKVKRTYFTKAHFYIEFMPKNDFF